MIKVVKFSLIILVCGCNYSADESIASLKTTVDEKTNGIVSLEPSEDLELLAKKINLIS